MAFRCRFPYLLRAGSNLHQSHRGLLSKKFLLQVEWGHGHERMGKFSLGGDYEWIAAVQKKFAGGGMASAIDVDVAVCGADEKDQLDDIIELMYKLRHTKFAADVLPSSEYAIIRAALKHNAVDLLFKVLSDPINYGIFLNEHSACLLVDYLLESNNVAGAAKVATIVMQQEMFSSTLANILCIYALLKWTELSPSQRLFDKVVLPPVKQEEVNEEDQKIFRFPFLKNDCSDEHFDLLEADLLVGKSLIWFSNNLQMEEQFLRDVRFLGCVLRKDWNGAVVLLSNGPVGGSTKNICFSFLEDSSTEAESKAHENVPKNEILGADIRHRLLDMLKSSELKGDSTPLSSRVLDKLKAVQDEEEAKEIKKQIDTFKEWSRKRMDLIKSQTERLSLRLRQEDILKEKAELQKKIERIHFFENRLKWEDEARRRDTLFKELKMKEKDTEKSEDEYRSSLFEITRKT